MIASEAAPVSKSSRGLSGPREAALKVFTRLTQCHRATSREKYRCVIGRARPSGRAAWAGLKTGPYR